MKLKGFCEAKNTVNRTNGSLQNGKRFLPTLIYRGLISKLYRELKKVDINKPNNPIQKWGAKLNREHSVEESQMTSKHFKR